MSELNIYQKISKVMEDIAFLTNDVTVGSGSYAFKAISETKVTMAVRESLIRNGLVIFPVEQVHHREDAVTPDKDGVVKISRISTVDVKYRIVDIATKEFIETVSSGTGCDSNDKGIGKAITYAYKYMCLKTFAIPTGDEMDIKKKAQQVPETIPGKKVVVTPANPPVSQEPPKLPIIPWTKVKMDTKDLNAIMKRIEHGAVEILPKVKEMYFITEEQEESINRCIKRVQSQLQPENANN